MVPPSSTGDGGGGGKWKASPEPGILFLVSSSDCDQSQSATDLKINPHLVLMLGDLASHNARRQRPGAPSIEFLIITFYKKRWPKRDGDLPKYTDDEKNRKGARERGRRRIK